MIIYKKKKTTGTPCCLFSNLILNSDALLPGNFVANFCDNRCTHLSVHLTGRWNFSGDLGEKLFQEKSCSIGVLGEHRSLKLKSGSWQKGTCKSCSRSKVVPGATHWATILLRSSICWDRGDVVGLANLCGDHLGKSILRLLADISCCCATVHRGHLTQ